MQKPGPRAQCTTAKNPGRGRSAQLRKTRAAGAVHNCERPKRQLRTMRAIDAKNKKNDVHCNGWLGHPVCRTKTVCSTASASHGAPLRCQRSESCRPLPAARGPRQRNAASTAWISATAAPSGPAQPCPAWPRPSSAASSRRRAGSPGPRSGTGRTGRRAPAARPGRRTGPRPGAAPGAASAGPPLTFLGAGTREAHVHHVPQRFFAK